MSRSFLSRFALVVLTACSLVSCSTSTPTAEEATPKPKPSTEKLQVVATTAVLCDLTKTIAESLIDLKCLIPADQDPHKYKPTKADKETLDLANVVLYNGHDLESQLIPVIEASSADRKIPVGQIAVTNPEKKSGKINPYVWHNAYKGLEMSKIIHQKLGAANKKNAATYEENYEKFDKAMTALHEWIKVQIASIPPKNRQIVSGRYALTYYSNPYNIAIEGATYDFTTETPPNEERIAALVKRIQDLKVKAVFNEVNVEGKSMKQVADRAKVPVAKGELLIDGLGKDNNYQKMMEHNTKIIVEGLGGKFQPFAPPKREKKDKAK